MDICRNDDDGIDDNDDEDVSCFFSSSVVFIFLHIISCRRFHNGIGALVATLSFHIHISTTFRSHSGACGLSLSNNIIININKKRKRVYICV